MSSDSDLGEELSVTFFPPLHLQRRIEILNILRKENITDVVDVGCGEGQLLSVLSVPSPWLSAPPSSLLYPDGQPPFPSPALDLFNTSSDPIPNLHITRLAGLDISSHDLQFAIQAIAPPPPAADSTSEETPMDPWRKSQGIRWEEMTAKIWYGGLEIINEEFVGSECIVATEVIEHLPPTVLPFFAPVLLGIYFPKFLLITTPSYKFNARFTSPNSHPSVRLRTGYLDPTDRTDRIFRHHDHKLEFTPEEFWDYCEKEAKDWGYTVDVSDIGRALEVDEWGRDAELGGASMVARFTRMDNPGLDRDAIAKRARAFVQTLSEKQSMTSESETLPNIGEHQLLASHYHPAHPSSQNPLSLGEIGGIVKARMEEMRESFLRIEELWYDADVSKACGGWIELLIRGVECNSDFLTLTKEAESPSDPRSLNPDSGYSGSEINIQRQRDLWKVGLVGATNHPRPLWPTTEIAEDDFEKSVEYMPSDWNPEREYKSEYSDEYDEKFDYGETAPSSSAEWEEPEEINTSYTTGEEGDVSWGEDDHEDLDLGPNTNKVASWGAVWEKGGWGEGTKSWGEDLRVTDLDMKYLTRSGRGRSVSMPLSSRSSMTGWDGDEDEPGDDTDITP